MNTSQKDTSPMTSLHRKLGVIALSVFALVVLFAVAAISPQSRPVERLAASPAPSASSVLASPIAAPATTTTAVAAPAKSVVARHTVAKPVAQVVTTTSTTAATDWPGPLQVAQAAVGTHPAYADKGFWCALAVDDWAEQGHIKNWKSEDGPGALANDALKDGRAHTTPQVGDMVFVDLRDPATKAAGNIPDVQIMHVGVVESVNGNEIGTIEGNADPSQKVIRNVRHVDDGYVVGFASFD